MDVSTGSSARGACRRLGARACSSELITQRPPNSERGLPRHTQTARWPPTGCLAAHPRQAPLLQADPLFKLSGDRVTRLHPPLYLTRVRLAGDVVRGPGPPGEAGPARGAGVRYGRAVSGAAEVPLRRAQLATGASVCMVQSRRLRCRRCPLAPTARNAACGPPGRAACDPARSEHLLPPSVHHPLGHPLVVRLLARRATPARAGRSPPLPTAARSRQDRAG